MGLDAVYAYAWHSLTGHRSLVSAIESTEHRQDVDDIYLDPKYTEEVRACPVTTLNGISYRMQLIKFGPNNGQFKRSFHRECTFRLELQRESVTNDREYMEFLREVGNVIAYIENERWMGRPPGEGNPQIMGYDGEVLKRPDMGVFVFEKSDLVSHSQGAQIATIEFSVPCNVYLNDIVPEMDIGNYTGVIPPTEATVRVYANGELEETLTYPEARANHA